MICPSQYRLWFDSAHKHEIIQVQVDGARAAGGHTIRNHPNWQWARTADDRELPSRRCRSRSRTNSGNSRETFGKRGRKPVGDGEGDQGAAATPRDEDGSKAAREAVRVLSP